MPEATDSIDDRQPLRTWPLHWSRGWAPLVVLPILVLVCFPASWPRWAFMWTLAFAIYVGCKWLTWRRTFVPDAAWWKHAGYLFAWPGMDAAAFLGSKDRSPVPTCRISEFRHLLGLCWEKRNDPIRLLGVGVKLIDLQDDGGPLQYELWPEEKKTVTPVQKQL